MSIVLDTNVFLGAAGGLDEESRVYATIIRVCHRVVMDDRIVDEYTKVLHDNGHNTTLVSVRMQELYVLNKLLYPRNVPRLEQDIITHEKDRHLIECAHVYGARIITYEENHLLNHRERIRQELGIDVLNPVEYITLHL